MDHPDSPKDPGAILEPPEMTLDSLDVICLYVRKVDKRIDAFEQRNVLAEQRIRELLEEKERDEALLKELETTVNTVHEETLNRLKVQNELRVASTLLDNTIRELEQTRLKYETESAERQKGLGDKYAILERKFKLFNEHLMTFADCQMYHKLLEEAREFEEENTVLGGKIREMENLRLQTEDENEMGSERVDYTDTEFLVEYAQKWVKARKEFVTVQQLECRRDVDHTSFPQTDVVMQDMDVEPIAVPEQIEKPFPGPIEDIQGVVSCDEEELPEEISTGFSTERCDITADSALTNPEPSDIDLEEGVQVAKPPAPRPVFQLPSFSFSAKPATPPAPCTAQPAQASNTGETTPVDAKPFQAPVAFELDPTQAGTRPKSTALKLNLIQKPKQTFESIIPAAFMSALGISSPLGASYTSFKPQLKVPQFPRFSPRLGAMTPTSPSIPLHTVTSNISASAGTASKPYTPLLQNRQCSLRFESPKVTTPAPRSDSASGSTTPKMVPDTPSEVPTASFFNVLKSPSMVFKMPTTPLIKPRPSPAKPVILLPVPARPKTPVFSFKAPVITPAAISSMFQPRKEDHTHAAAAMGMNTPPPSSNTAKRTSEQVMASNMDEASSTPKRYCDFGTMAKFSQNSDIATEVAEFMESESSGSKFGGFNFLGNGDDETSNFSFFGRDEDDKPSTGTFFNFG